MLLINQFIHPLFCDASEQISRYKGLLRLTNPSLSVYHLFNDRAVFTRTMASGLYKLFKFKIKLYNIIEYSFKKSFCNILKA